MKRSGSFKNLTHIQKDNIKTDHRKIRLQDAD
jgi:hypothetical protein